MACNASLALSSAFQHACDSTEVRRRLEASFWEMHFKLSVKEQYLIFDNFLVGFYSNITILFIYLLLSFSLFPSGSLLHLHFILYITPSFALWSLSVCMFEIPFRRPFLLNGCILLVLSMRFKVLYLVSVNKFQIFISMTGRARHWCLTWARWIQFSPSSPTYVRPILTSSSQ